MVRSVYEYNVSGEYIDIAYHFLIDQNGRIYEGRWARDYPAGVPHTGENAAHANVQGAATLGHNPHDRDRDAGHVHRRVADSGRDERAQPCWRGSARVGGSTRGSTPYTNSNGGVEVFPDIIGHRSVVPTICPGDPIIARLAQIRDQVDARLRTGTFGYWIAGSGGRTRRSATCPTSAIPAGSGSRA